MIYYIILGLIQGLTEFLPVSSSAHLIILEHLMGINENQLAIAVVLHLGTASALVIFFFKDLLGLLKNLRLLFLLFVVTLITVSIGLAGKDFFENLFSSIYFAGISLAISGVILLITRKFMDGKRNDFGFKDAVILGIVQAIAIIPGISRSGVTVSTLLFRKLNRISAFRISFLAAIPVIFGAAIFETRKINLALKAESANLILGFIASLFTGLIALWVLKLVLRKSRLYYFGYYCIIIAVITLLFIK